jgi:hypothetical protein
VKSTTSFAKIKTEFTGKQAATHDGRKPFQKLDYVEISHPCDHEAVSNKNNCYQKQVLNSITPFSKSKRG